MLLSEGVRSGTKEPYRNHICIQDELRLRGGREHCPPALYQAPPLTLSSCPSLPTSLIYCLPLFTLSAPATPTSSPFFHSMAPLALSFQRVPRSTGACSSEQGIVQFSAGVDELICSRECVCVILHGCVRTCPEASISKPLRVEICVCVLQLF